MSGSTVVRQSVLTVEMTVQQDTEVTCPSLEHVTPTPHGIDADGFVDLKIDFSQAVKWTKNRKSSGLGFARVHSRNDLCK
jgi:hypothetical protein